MREPDTGTFVAVKKFIRQKGQTTAEMKAAFNRELLNLVTISHPCIQSVLGWDVADSDLLIVTEYLENGSLEGVIDAAQTEDRPAFFDDTGVAIMCAGILLGLRYMHSRNIIHRDVKALNILVDHRGYAQIADLGLTREEGADMTMAGIGTALYMPPELASADVDDGGYTRAIDVYAFSLVLYRLVTGLPLFPEYRGTQTVFPLLNAIGRGVRPPLPATVLPEVAAIITDCWSPNPEARPTFSAVFERLRALDYRVLPGVDSDRVHQFVQEVLELELACVTDVNQ
jgi:serine/threonine protein kinase